jgi:hypothetical protein
VGLKAGIGRKTITPEIGGNLFGYRPDVVSESLNDDLTVTAAAFCDGRDELVLISATVCLISDGLANEVRNQTGAALGIDPSRVVICATHTHSGPNTVGWTGWGDIDKSYCDSIFVPGCVKAAECAWKSLKPVQAGFGETRSYVGVNRRQVLKDDSVVLGQNPWGVFDPSMTVIAFTDSAGKPFFNIIHYGAHCTAAGMNREITRDWAGGMIDRLEKESGALTMFVNGTEGDTGPRISNGATTGNLFYALELGGLAAIDAVRAWRSIKEFREAEFGVTEGDITIPYAPLWPLETVQKKLAENEGKEPPTVNLEGAVYRTLNEIKAHYERGETKPGNYVIPQTLFRIGPAVFVPFRFETFSEIGLRLRAYSPFQHTLTMSNANGAVGYLPAESDLCRGGYEVEMFLWRNTWRFPNDTDTKIINENLKIMEAL